MKLGKASGLSEVSMEMINASGKVGVDVMVKLCQEYLIEKECWKIGRLECWFQFTRQKEM